MLARNFWTEPEDGEMQIYANHWENPPKRRCGLATAMRPKRCSNLDGQFFLQRHFREQVMRHARRLRNSVSHRDSLDEHSAWHSAWNTIVCFILIDDRSQSRPSSDMGRQVARDSQSAPKPSGALTKAKNRSSGIRQSVGSYSVTPMHETPTGERGIEEAEA